jgi:Tfp pilus assembly protein PilF
LPDGHFLIEINPELEKSVNKALDQAQRGNTHKAMTALTELLHDHPRSHLVAFGIGCVHAVLGKHEESIQWFDKAIAIYPYFVEAHYNKAVAFQKLLDLPNCIRSYQKVVEFGEFTDPEVGQARSFIAIIAAGVLKKDGIELDDYLKSSDFFNQAFESMERSDFKEALEGFRASAAINEWNAPCNGNIGLCHAYLGHKADALAALDRALEIVPDYLPAGENRKQVEKMDEGAPMTHAAFKAINYGLESFKEEKK